MNILNNTKNQNFPREGKFLFSLGNYSDIHFYHRAAIM